LNQAAPNPSLSTITFVTWRAQVDNAYTAYSVIYLLYCRWRFYCGLLVTRWSSWASLLGSVSSPPFLPAVSFSANL